MRHAGSSHTKYIKVNWLCHRVRIARINKYLAIDTWTCIAPTDKSLTICQHNVYGLAAFVIYSFLSKLVHCRWKQYYETISCYSGAATQWFLLTIVWNSSTPELWSSKTKVEDSKIVWWYQNPTLWPRFVWLYNTVEFQSNWHSSMTVTSLTKFWFHHLVWRAITNAKFYQVWQHFEPFHQYL
jgi:hypothetical protein